MHYQSFFSFRFFSFLLDTIDFFYMDFSPFFYYTQLVTSEICDKSMSYGIIVKMGVKLIVVLI